MKKILALILAAMMVFGCTASLAEVESTPMKLTLTDAVSEAVEAQPAAWIENVGNRALLTATLFLDYLVTTDREMADYDVFNSYVYQFELEGIIMYSVVIEKKDNSTLMIVYCPELATAHYTMIDGDVNDLVASDENSADFFFVDSGKLQEAFDVLQRLLSE